jgi:hypothetical protein
MLKTQSKKQNKIVKIILITYHFALHKPKKQAQPKTILKTFAI